MNVMGIIFTNDADIGALTDKRTMASLPFGGRYRQVDFGLSNLCGAGVRRVGIISRHNYQSLMNHIGDGEDWGLELGEGGLEFLTPYATSATHTYRGKVESLSYAMDFLEFGDEDEYIFMIDSAVLCNIDLNKVLAAHIKSGKILTVVAKAGYADGKRPLDLAIKVDEKGEVCDMMVDYAASEDYLASMDILVCSKKWLIDRVKKNMARNLFHMDRDLILDGWQKGGITVNVYPFEGVAMFNNSVEEYFANSLALVNESVRHDLFGGAHQVYTKVRDRVPAYYGDDVSVRNTVVADGCTLEGSVSGSVLFRQVTIAPGAEVENCVIMNDTVVGEGAQLKNVILDKDVTVTPGAKLFGTAKNPIVIKRGEVV